jgi:4-carboxymuconolactone decarboxylase
MNDTGLQPSSPCGSPTVRLAKPRIPPLQEAQWTDAHRQLVAKYSHGGRVGNDLKILLNVPALIEGMMPFQNYIKHDTSLTPRHRDILILRTGWLLGSEYVWSQHAAIAKKRGMTATDLRRIAEGPNASGFDQFEATLLRLADQMFRNSSVNDATWKALSVNYDMYHLMDAVMTVADFTTVSLIYNSIGVQPDEEAADRIPTDIPYIVSVPEREPALKVERVEPVEGADAIAIKRTWARYPKLAEQQRIGSQYVMYHTKLNPRYREILILRTGWNCQAEYEWAQHMGKVGRGREKRLDPLKIAEGPNASGWAPFEIVLLNAADDLYRDSIVSDWTWDALAERFDSNMIMEALFSASNYRMISMACNTFGVQVDDDELERLPVLTSDVIGGP